MIAPLTPVAFSNLSGWQSVNVELSLAAFRRSAREMLSKASGFARQPTFGGNLGDWQPACAAGLAANDARYFFESYFRPFQVFDQNKPEGLFTGYYEPEVQGVRQPDPGFPVPVYRRPADLVTFTPDETRSTGLSYGRRVNGLPVAYDTREMIENGALAGQALEICWLHDWADAFFMQVQGSGRVKLQAGGEIRLAYAGKTGLPYTGIGGVLLQKGIGTPETMSMQVLRHWMKQHPAEARSLMWNNKSYVFFQEITVAEPNLGAVGAAKVNLTPLRSLAVDRRHWMFGMPVYLETTTPPETPGGARPFVELMIAQDTGTAIKGLARGDVYWGWGETQAHIAGHMKSPGRMAVLLPVAVAQRLGLL